ncbi:hypothetical protein CFOLD11_32550 [Clostridium folliculivorans]|uniref:Prepilin-type N-terminal cleavage/methylation domain-containing protein n=1 Tax=Clostridium folliculivorans TaxID=2886038 RepID=A0A9W5Y4D3_9CLOT|nr:prepilin-type N-terminal cleavage/methylation domain-containing protein [Clostridium folliculivorans]GKU26428.1 hypothetical protein CFOLD11_32550 [Clostridium folliculivorans]
MIKKKGFTLIEAVIVLALISVVIMVIYPFFFSSSRSLNETNVRADLQTDGQLIQNSLLNYGNQGSSIDRINGIVPPSNSNEITTISNFRIILYADVSKTIEYVYDNTNKKLNEITNLNATGTVTKTLSGNVDSIKISPVGGTYLTCEGLIINITLKKNNITYDISSKIVFRNKGIATS